MTPPLSRRPTVLVVDDSAFMRKLIAEMLSSELEFEVVGFARDGVDALRQVELLDPNLVTLDLEMPHLDGLQVLHQIMTRSPRPVVVLSAGGPQFGDATMRALELGAVDFVKKPSGPISLDLPAIRGRLLQALRTAVTVDIQTIGRIGPALSGWSDDSDVSSGTDQRVRSEHNAAPARHVVVIGASTGGPRALAEIIPALPEDLDAAVLVAQHMPREFTRSLARRLDHVSRVPVSEAVHGEPVLAGRVYIAPGKTHMHVAGLPRVATVTLDAHPSGVSPSADELFTSAARVFGIDVLGVVLTGMGRDGAQGARAVRDAGGRVIVQDRATSVIYGMPSAALAVVDGSRVVALHDMAAAVVQELPSTSKAAAPGAVFSA